MKLVSLFSGAGGLDLGFHKAGFEPLLAVEMDPDAADTLRKNGYFTKVLEENLELLSSSRLLDEAGLEVGELDMLVGGPPCQPFSRSSWNAKRLVDPRAGLLEEFFRVVRDLRPRVFLMENVPGVGYKDGDEGWELIVELVDDLNDATGDEYVLAREVLDAARYGVPQHRKRLFIVGSRDGREFEFPEATHGDASTNGTEAIQPYLTAWDAIGGLAEPVEEALAPSGQWAELLPSIPEGKNYLHHTARGDGVPLFGWRRKFWSFLLKLAKDRPSPTLTANPGSSTGPFHWSNRKLAIEEMLLLQTFPSGYVVEGKRTSQQRQVGNAVPPALAQRLAIEVRAQLLDDRHARKRRMAFLPSRRADVPETEETLPVAAKYLDLVGDYDAHPGPGKGPGALARESETTCAERLTVLRRAVVHIAARDGGGER